MAAAEEEAQPELFLSYFNAPQPKIIYLTNPISPSSSAQSENSLESGNQQQPHDPDSSTDDSTEELTNLTWLTQLKTLVAWPNSINPILDDDNDNRNRILPASVVHAKKDTLNDRFHRFLSQARQNRDAYDKIAELYQSDTSDKPPFNYAQMIAMAMLENGRMTLQHICTWIQTKFGYYRVRNNWNNSIRHNLSLQFCFRKIDRNVYNKGDGKGGYWELGIDANKSERKRIRNRKSLRSTTTTTVTAESVTSFSSSTIDESAIEQKRFKFAAARTDDILVVDDDIDNDDDMFNRTLNSLNTAQQTGNDQSTLVGSIIEVDQQPEQRTPPPHEHIDMSTNQTTHEYYVMADIANGDYLNIGALDLVAASDDMFESGNFSGAATTANVTAITMVDPVTMEAQCSNQIFLASELPQPSENVVISALNQYGSDDGDLHGYHATTADSSQGILENIAYSLPMDDNNLKSYFDGIDQEFQLLRSTDNRGGDDLIDALYDMSTGQDF